MSSLLMELNHYVILRCIPKGRESMFTKSTTSRPTSYSVGPKFVHAWCYIPAQRPEVSGRPGFPVNLNSPNRGESLRFLCGFLFYDLSSVKNSLGIHVVPVCYISLAQRTNSPCSEYKSSLLKQTFIAHEVFHSKIMRQVFKSFAPLMSFEKSTIDNTSRLIWDIFSITNWDLLCFSYWFAILKKSLTSHYPQLIHTQVFCNQMQLYIIYSWYTVKWFVIKRLESLIHYDWYSYVEVLPSPYPTCFELGVCLGLDLSPKQQFSYVK